MEKTSYNIKTELPGLLDHSRKILGLYKPLTLHDMCYFHMKLYLCRCRIQMYKCVFFSIYRYTDGFADSCGTGKPGNHERLRWTSLMFQKWFSYYSCKRTHLIGFVLRIWINKRCFTLWLFKMFMWVRCGNLKCSCGKLQESIWKLFELYRLFCVCLLSNKKTIVAWKVYHRGCIQRIKID